ncbi:MAG: glycosyltransferase family 4 protein [Acidobacteria bacterium]|nr:glycosyltransferase family 4 protein [Acidobacteriota bacterium]
MRNRLIKRDIAGSKIHVAENWADGQIIRPVAWPPAGSPLTVLYSGNLGLAHDVETLQRAVGQLKEDQRFRFIFAGSGARRSELEAWCRLENVQNIEFRPYSSRSLLGESLGSAHIGLITQRDSCLGSVVPSKIYGLLAAGRPVLFIGPSASTVAQIIERFDCGWHVNCGDERRLLHLLSELLANPSEIVASGKRARQAFMENYDRPLGVERICRLIGACDREQSRVTFQTLATDYDRLPAANG